MEACVQDYNIIYITVELSDIKLVIMASLRTDVDQKLKVIE